MTTSTPLIPLIPLTLDLTLPSHHILHPVSRVHYSSRYTSGGKRNTESDWKVISHRIVWYVVLRMAI